LALGGLITLSGCSGSTSSQGSTTTPPTTPANGLTAGGASTIFVGQVNGATCGTVDQFAVSTSTSATTSAAPASGLILPSSNAGFALAADSSGQLYVACTSPRQIYVYAAGATGSATPTRSVTIPNTAFTAAAITVDASGQIYVLDEMGGVSIYAATASGTTAPVRTIAGSATGIGPNNVPQGLAVDPSGNVYVSVATGATSSILVFPATANGNVAPTRTITSTAGGAMQGAILATDANGNLYAAYSTYATGSTIAEFGPTASGVATPTRLIAGSATGLAGIGSIRLDSVGNLYVYTSVLGTYNQIVEAFSSTASGNVAPAVQITYNLLGLAPINSLAVK
jgi:hypothetical protein